MRQYDENLVAAICEKQYTQTIDGIDILFKPVPDARCEHTLDPRLKTVIEHKEKMFADRAHGGFSLYGERYRPDKVTFDLTTSPVEREEHLIDIDGTHRINLYVYRSVNAPKSNCPILVYLHGGGFTAGDIRLFENQMKYIAELSGGVVVFPEYRLAPENPYPAPIEDAWGAVKWVHANAVTLGGDATRLMVAGDSAGGSLTNACVLLDQDSIIKKIVEIYPAFDMTDYHVQQAYDWSYEAYQIVPEEKELAYSRIDRIKSGIDSDPKSYNSLYLQGKATPEHPLVSAIFATDEQLKRFPPAVIVSSEYDYLRVGSDYAVKKLHSLGVDVRSVRYCGCDHGFFDLLGTLVQAEDLCKLLATELCTVSGRVTE